MPVARNVKAFVDQWFMEHGYLQLPTYKVKKLHKPTEDGQPRFHAIVKFLLKEKTQSKKRSFSGRGIAMTPKVARIKAAIILCHQLLKFKYMDRSEFDTLTVNEVESRAQNNKCKRKTKKEEYSMLKLRSRTIARVVEPEAIVVVNVSKKKKEKRALDTPDLLPLKKRRKHEMQDSSNYQDSKFDGPIIKNGNPPESNFENVAADETSDIFSSSSLTTSTNFSNNSEALDHQIWHHFYMNQQSQAFFDAKFQTTEFLLQLMRSNMDKFVPVESLHLMACGSTVNGLGNARSDLDLCLIHVSNCGIISDNRSIALRILKVVRTLFYRFLRNRCSAIQLIPARVPILRVQRYNHDSFTFDIDINVNNITGVRNSHLLHYYSALDERFCALFLAIKQWAVKVGICDAKCGTFSSYCLSLLLIHFLQCGVVPNVLPNLQDAMPYLFDPKIPVFDLKLFTPIVDPRPYDRNIDSVASLLLKFFDYYANTFNFEREAISIRSASKVYRYQLSKHTDYLVHLEEPFDGTNVGRCIQNRKCFDRIKLHFSYSNNRLNQTLNLSSIGVKLQ